MNKKRWLSIVFLLIFCVSGILMLYFRQLNTKGYVVIYIDGNVVQRETLSEQKEFDVQSDYGINHIIIQNGSVWVSDADCANKICVRTGTISNASDVISCLPHHLIITIEKEGQVDSIAY